MGPIPLSPEPPCLERHRRQVDPPPTWKNLSAACKRAVRAQLRRDQRDLCAYCGRSLPAPPLVGDDTVTVEHFVAQAADPARALRWTNLLLVCEGRGLGARGTCDRAKGDTRIAVDPRGASVVGRLLTTHTGVVRPGAGPDPEAERAIAVLRLNDGRLKAARGAAMAVVTRHLRAGASPESLLAAVRREGAAAPFAPQIEDDLRRRL